MHCLLVHSAERERVTIVRSIPLSSLSLLYETLSGLFHDKSTVELNVKLQPAVLSDCGVINPRHCHSPFSTFLCSGIPTFQFECKTLNQLTLIEQTGQLPLLSYLHPHGMTSIGIPGLESVDLTPPILVLRHPGQ